MYRDAPGGDPTAGFALSPTGEAGLRRWREQNCLACHQLYGFGGYLGPDLTHVTSRVDRASFLQILRAGTGPMPPVAMDEAAADELYVFLAELGTSGQGHMLGAAGAPTWPEVFRTIASDEVSPGAELFERFQCGRCHIPLQMGHVAAPDLTRTWERMSVGMIEGILLHGRGNMPLLGLDRVQADALTRLLRTLNERRGELHGEVAVRTALPWFNYERPSASTPDRPESDGHR